MDTLYANPWNTRKFLKSTDKCVFLIQYLIHTVGHIKSVSNLEGHLSRCQKFYYLYYDRLMSLNLANEN